MEIIPLGSLAIKILIGCDKKSLSKKDITQHFKRHPHEFRLNSIAELLSNGLIEKKEMPHPNTKKQPTYYFITDNGKKWLKKYLEHF